MITNFSLFEKVNKKEKKEYKYGCAMVFFKIPEMKSIHELIDKNDLYSSEEEPGKYGLEKETHCTLLYGLHSDEIDDDDVIEACESLEIGILTLTNASLFENEKYDVVKFDVKGDNLKAINKKLCEFPYTTDYPDYHPHATIAYVKPGKGKAIIEKIGDIEYEATPYQIVYSKPDGTKIKRKIKDKNEE